jgi:hypothetical protein
MAGESPQIRLPGRLYRKRSRWWWNVRLPGDKAARCRALRPEGSRLATTDRGLAQEIAFGLWQEALQAQAVAAVRAEQAAKILRLRQNFRHKLKTLRDDVEAAEARAQAEATFRADLEARLNDLMSRPPAEPQPPVVQTAPCECCHRDVPQDQLQRIDSGQRLCPQCLDDLHQAAQRPPSDEQEAQKTESKKASSSILNLSFEDPPYGRNTYGSRVLHAQAGRR